tara:strand:+ start:94 stop:387 length:294 start_codon:yes stop_codon:yes gene_type:complete
MINQMTIDQTAELSNQELSLEQLEDIHGGVHLLVILGGIGLAGYAAYKGGKWLVNKVSKATANLDGDRDSGDDANKLSYRDTGFTLSGERESTSLIV